MLEFAEESRASAFMRDNKQLEMDDAKIKVERYATRVAKWEKEKPKNGNCVCFKANFFVLLMFTLH